MRINVVLGIVGCVASLAFPVLGQSQVGIPGVLADGVVAELIQEGFTDVEGPVGAADGSVYFSDRKPDRTYHVDSNGKVTIYRENTNAGNGLAFSPDGAMIVAEGSGKRISRIGHDGQITTLTEGRDRKPLINPNDLIVDAKGGIYFTEFGAAPGGPDIVSCLYYLPPGARQPLIVDESVPRPNGLVLTNDGKTLLVDSSTSDTVFAYDVQSDGTAKNRRTFAQLHDVPAGVNSRGDGMAIDREGRVYVTTAFGIQVFDAGGKYLGKFSAPRRTANLAFAGPDKRTLYLTAEEGLYRIRMLTPGPDRLGK
jgi:gluconolactonase